MLFASGKVTDMHMKSKGRWAGDIAYIYARFCPEMDREAVRAMGQADRSPFMECADSHWASLSGWTEDAADLGDDEESDDDDESALITEHAEVTFFLFCVFCASLVVQYLASTHFLENVILLCYHGLLTATENLSAIKF